MKFADVVFEERLSLIYNLNNFYSANRRFIKGKARKEANR